MPHGAGPGQPWFDPLVFAPVTAAFGTAGFNRLFGPGAVNFDTGYYSTITSVTGGLGREGIDERGFRLGLRIRF